MAASRLKTVSVSFVLPIAKSRPSATVIEEKPAPTLVRQTTGGPSFGQGLNQWVSGEIPSRFGPRHRGQSAAAAVDEASRPSASSRRAGPACAHRKV